MILFVLYKAQAMYSVNNDSWKEIQVPERLNI